MRNFAFGFVPLDLLYTWQSYPTQPVYACIAAVIALVVVVACRAYLNPVIGKDL